MKTRAWIWVASSTVVVGAVAAVFLVRPAAVKAPVEQPAADAPQKPEAAPAQKPVEAAVDEAAPKRPMGDAEVRALLEAASPDERLHGWLREGNLLRRWAVALDNVAEGQIPRRDLPFLQPATPFTASESLGRLTIDPQSYHRWDAVAQAVASVDAHLFARAVRAVHGPLQAAWRALGYPGKSLDARAAEALTRLGEAPILRDPPEVVQAGKYWVFADPELEQLPPIEKLVIRMGPHNGEIVQQKAREIARALGYASVSAK